MIKIKNPLDEDLKLHFKGESYTLEAGVTKQFPADVATQWVVIYDFLTLTSATDKEKDEMVELADEAKKAAKKTAKKAAKKVTKDKE